MDGLYIYTYKYVSVSRISVTGQQLVCEQRNTVRGLAAGREVYFR